MENVGRNLKVGSLMERKQRDRKRFFAQILKNKEPRAIIAITLDSIRIVI